MKKTSLSILVLLLIFSCGDSVKESTKKNEEVVEEVDSLIVANDAIVKNASDPELYYSRSELLFNRGQIDEAMNDIRRAIGLDSIVSKYHVMKGELFLRQANIAMAKTSYSTAIDIDPANKDAHSKLSLYYLGLTDYSQALKSADNALRLDVRDPKTYFLKGRIFLAAADTTRALSSFQTATEMKPNYFEAFLLLGVVTSNMGDPLAKSYYKSAIEIRPENTKALYGLGHLEMMEGDYPAAVKTFRKITTYTPEDPIPHFNIGHMFMSNNIDSSISHYSKAISLSPDYFQAYYNRGLCFEAQENIESCEKDYRAALAIKPDYELAIEGLNRIIK